MFSLVWILNKGQIGDKNYTVKCFCVTTLMNFICLSLVHDSIQSHLLIKFNMYPLHILEKIKEYNEF